MFSSVAVGHKDVHIRFKRANDLMPSKRITELKFLVLIGCGLAKSAATQKSVSKSAANSARLERVSFLVAADVFHPSPLGTRMFTSD